ncbi:MAG: outer membrane lipoprotein carrier protein LolA [Desulfobacteraceae bacterium]|nr:MAG: outer membrane lipoprotein carrier protein LolA [Desulfobacteraceae bacterium]
MKKGFFYAILIAVIACTSGSLHAAAAPALDEIIGGVEKKYSAEGFSAHFLQTSTLKAMQVTEQAKGLLFAEKPDKMRWEYREPERQLVVSDGVNLWVYRPADNQVMIGKAPAFFGDGKGAGFLSDIRRVRENFDVTLEGTTEGSNYLLKLLPKKKTFDIAAIYLTISSSDFSIVEVTTLNEYRDETRIRLEDIQFRSDLDDSLFSFVVPDGADVVKMDQ